jgi:serine protease Do
VDCAAIDEQVVRPQDEELKELLDEFVCVRITRMNDVDIGVFQFDFDLTWACFFLDGNDRVYSRYGSRDADSAETRVSVAGLKHTMRAVLADHQPPTEYDELRPPFLAREVYTRERGCMHCHNVWEGLRERARTEGTFTPESLFVYPLPENIGLTLDVERGNEVVAVQPGSPASRAGIEPSDILARIGTTEIRSQADVTHALHLAPQEGEVALRWRRAEKTHEAVVSLTRGWKRTDLSWRASMRGEPSGP